MKKKLNFVAMKKVKYLLVALFLITGLATETFAAPNYLKTSEQLRSFFGIPATYPASTILGQIITALDQNKVAMQNEMANLSLAKINVTLSPTTPSSQTVVAPEGNIYGTVEKVDMINFDINSTASAVVSSLTSQITISNYVQSPNAYLVDVNSGAILSSVQLGADPSMVTFENINLPLTAGLTKRLAIKLDLKIRLLPTPESYSGYSNEVTLTGLTAKSLSGTSIPSTNVNLVPFNLRGNRMYIMPSGPKITFISQSTGVNPVDGLNNDVGLFKIRYKIQAVNTDVYTPAINAESMDNYDNYLINKNGVDMPFAYGVSTSIIDITDGTKSPNGNYVIRRGEEEVFEWNLNLPLGTDLSAGYYRATMEWLNWNTRDALATIRQINLDQKVFRTNYVSLASVEKQTQIASIQESLRQLIEELNKKLGN